MSLNALLSPASLPKPWRWGLLVLLSVIFASVLEWFRLPAALLLGPMIAAILLASRGVTTNLSGAVFCGAQGIVGLMIASNLPLSTVGEVSADWPIFVAGTLSTLVAASLLGWWLMRSGTIPGTSAIWGTSPGAATVMTLMSEAYGADMRLVAFMQYLRVVICAIAATLVARLFGVAGAGHETNWLSDETVWRQAPLAVALALSCAWLGVRLRLPGGPLLCTMVVGIIAKFIWPVSLMPPLPVLAIAYACVGWGIGQRFTPDVLIYVARLFPRLLLSTLALVGICACFGGLLVVFAHVDPLTAYLATSPGGADSVAIIASATKVDVPFVMAMQVARFLFVLVAGPSLARLLSRRLVKPQPCE